MIVSEKLRTSTHTSKLLAFILFIVVPIASFFLGIQYEKQRIQARILPITPTQMPVIATPTVFSQQNPTIHLEQYSDPATWIYFNENFAEAPARNFLFKYPPIFTIKNYDSASVILYDDTDMYLAIEEIIGINKYPRGSTELEKLQNYYDDINNNYPDIDPPLIYKKISLQNNTVVYQITYSGEGACGGSVSDKPHWYCYIADIDGYGLSVTDLKQIPEDIILRILNSVQFRLSR